MNIVFALVIITSAGSYDGGTAIHEMNNTYNDSKSCSEASEMAKTYDGYNHRIEAICLPVEKK